MKYCTKETFRELVSRMKKRFGGSFTRAEIERHARAVLAEHRITIGVPLAEKIRQTQVRTGERAVILHLKGNGLLE